MFGETPPANRRNHLATVLLICLIAAMLFIGFLGYPFIMKVLKNPCPGGGTGIIPLAVLGDSDSHSYHDTISFKNPLERGGKFRSITFQWTEVLERLRNNQIDQGSWGVWGSKRGLIAELRSAIGLEGRAPKKLDFQYNFAVSGAGCADLVEGYGRQTQRLLYLMKKKPLQWQNGLIVIRIGINSIGQTRQLERYAEEGFTAAARESILKPINYVRMAVVMIRKEFPTVRIVLIGDLDDSDWAPNLSKWHSARELAGIHAALDFYDSGLRSIARGYKYTAFSDDRKWFRELWGERDSLGIPAYKTVTLGGSFPVYNSQGDDPHNNVVGDGHAGTVWNGLWAANLIKLVNREFNMNITPITDDEILGLIQKGPPAKK